MPNISDMNIILGQASAIKQMQTIPAQAAEQNALLAAQAAAALQKKEQARVQHAKPGDGPELNREKKHTQDKTGPLGSNTRSGKPGSPGSTAAGRIVDIKI
jgi:hypothetical protein